MKHQAIRRFLLLALGLMAGSGCARHDLDQDLHDEFKGMVSGYETQVEKIAESDRKHAAATQQSAPVPNEIKSDITAFVAQPIYSGSTVIKKSLENLYVSALQNSSQIKVFSDVPLIRETGIQEAQGVFDTHFFTEAMYDRDNDPVGSTLTVGGNGTRFRQNETTLESGYKKKINTGADITLSEKIGYTDNNSTFFTPKPQGSAELKLRVVQPLLNGAGYAYNASVIQIAELDSDIARNEFVRQTESHLLEVTRTYWTVYLARASYAERRKLADETKSIVGELEARQQLDTVKRQVLRARGAAAERRADLVRSEAAVRNAQDRLQALLNDPEIGQQTNFEIIPLDQPFSQELPVDIRLAAISALKNRPEIAQGFLQLKAAAVREKMQKREVMPTLNLILEGSLKGLKEEGKVTAAVEDQTRRGGPGYLVGLVFDVPIENNAADARHRRRLLELRQQFRQLITTIETVLLEVKVTVRELRTSYRDLQAKHATLLASREELDDLRAKKELQIGSDDVPTSSYLDSLLDSQDRRTRAEDEFLRALVTYNVAVVTMERAKGNLLSYEGIKIDRTLDENNLPELQLKKVSETMTPYSGLNKEAETEETKGKHDPESFPYRDAIPLVGKEIGTAPKAQEAKPKTSPTPVKKPEKVQPVKKTSGTAKTSEDSYNSGATARK